jgi:hypothetical protein
MNKEQNAFAESYKLSMARITRADIQEFFEQLPINPADRCVLMPSYKWDEIDNAWSVWCGAILFTEEPAGGEGKFYLPRSQHD